MLLILAVIILALTGSSVSICCSVPARQASSAAAGAAATTSVACLSPSRAGGSTVKALPSSSPGFPQSTTNGGGYIGPCSKSSTCKGEATYYDTATSASAPSSCEWTNDGSTENVVALPAGFMGDNNCGRTVIIRYGRILATGRVVDKCNGCDGTSLDLSRHLFGELAPFSEGRLFGVEWWIE
ncbi:hypothetical protein EYZ11_012872 [Aspergillus tanneri]|uniref:RlpA-like protein double-psi beta-barrel domain-containing protein n=1 Tax=Aspergillus tanneri TaxID=1220188 RepID=A0A4S3J4H7_9EURO|nr:uncharacterized protein ATNIH1004_011682 [Aspergillus tanneri]KAA8641546.1 hypothetical protein ATNIH1004_011682 [Aspergillus tanneri]THC87681.1 hypothetical protein EYZ11_012872 [Aspergillus tanneri]